MVRLAWCGTVTAAAQAEGYFFLPFLLFLSFLFFLLFFAMQITPLHDRLGQQIVDKTSTYH